MRLIIVPQGIMAPSVGAHAPGGAFQAGSVLGAAGVLLLLSGWRPNVALMALPLRIIIVIGPMMFVASCRRYEDSPESPSTLGVGWIGVSA